MRPEVEAILARMHVVVDGDGSAYRKNELLHELLVDLERELAFVAVPEAGEEVEVATPLAEGAEAKPKRKR